MSEVPDIVRGQAMTNYRVSVTETIIHTLEVEADSEGAAIEKGKALIGEVSDEVLKDNFGYQVDSVDWTGWEEAEEL